MTGPGSSMVRRQLGRRLRDLRLAAGKDIADVVTAGLASKAKLNRIEFGKGPVRVADVWALSRLYGADQATTDELAALAPATSEREWWETYGRVVVPDYFGLLVSLETQASRMRCFDPSLVHGLLQTEEYARAVIGSEDTLPPDVVERRVTFRMDRGRRVLGNRPDLTVILGEAALKIVVGSPPVMAAQLDHLRELDRGGVATIRVLPFRAGAYPVTGGFALLEFEHQEDPSVAHVEFSMGARYVEQPSQVAQHEHVFTVLANRTIPIEEWK